MPQTGSLLQSRLVLRGWLLAAAAGLLVLGWRLTAVGRNWPLGDWLINYEGGFVRRGLAGEALLMVGHEVHVDPVRLAALVCLLCYGVVLAGCWRWLRHPSQPWWVAFAILSPAMFTFPLLSTRAGFHKEVLLYAAVTLLLLVFRQGHRPGAWRVAAGLSAASVFLVLSHEPVVFYLPYLFVVPMLATLDVRYCVRALLLPVLLTLVSFSLVLQHIGSAATVAAICASVHANTADPCADPIGFLTMTRVGQLAMVRENVTEFHYWRTYPVLFGLSLVPVVLGGWALWRRPVLRGRLVLTFGAAGIAGVSSVALFRFGPDWGRWIAMHVVCFVLLLLWLKDEAGGEAEPVHLQGRSRRVAWSAGLLAYALCWSMPGFGDGPLQGVRGLLLHWP